MFAIDAAAGADVVAHLFQPGELVAGECDSGSTLFFEPSIEALADMFFEWLKRSCWLDCGANEGDEIRKAAGLRAICRTARRAIPTCFKGIPDSWNRLWSQLWL